MDDLEDNSALNSAYYEDEINKVLKDKQKVITFEYPLNSTSLLVPATHGYPERKIIFKDNNHKDKALIFRLIVAAYNYTFTDEFSPLSTKGNFSITSSKFVAWLNGAEISNRYSILKDYESCCFDLYNNHGGNSVLHRIKNLFSYAYRNEQFLLSLKAEEAKYLIALKNTKVSPNLNKKQKSLASYFGALNWLRREDLGVGNQVYSILASPKMTVNSLKSTASVVIIELYKSKSTLRSFISDSGLSESTFGTSDFRSKTRRQRCFILSQAVYTLLCKYHEMKVKTSHLRHALELVLLSNVTNRANFEELLPALDSKEEMDMILCKNRSQELSSTTAERIFRVEYSGPLLSVEVLQQLSDPNAALAITQQEAWVFSWLMASLTVQPTDIAKLSRDSFRTLKVAGRVTHIECEYFKGRSNAIHNTRILSTRKIEGRALLLYLGQHSGKALRSFDTDLPAISAGISSISGMLNALLSLPFILDQMSSAHRRQGRIPVVIPLLLNSLITHGKHIANIAKNVKTIKLNKRQALVSKSETPCPKNLFGLQAIKNSAVHAYSDPYTLHYLVNRNSHTNQTEKQHYLNADNEEWMNAAGRITRSVMFDLINNVFDLDFCELNHNQTDKAKAAFNNEFANVTNNISYKKGEMLSRLKVITEQGKGTINDTGVLSFSDKSEEEYLPIYVLDSQVTAFKIFNYLEQFKNNYKKLLSCNPEHLYQTALPTVEWMERVLTILDKDSVSNGEKLFVQMKKSGVSVRVFHSI